MPGALEGRPAGFSYIYAVSVSVAEVESYYLDQMQTSGWELASRQSSENSAFGGPSVVLDFTRGNEQVNVVVVFSTADDYSMVILTLIE